MKKLGLIGDPHARPGPLTEALQVFAREQVDAIWCTGDIAGYGEELEETVELLKAQACQCILGNHEQWYLDQDEDQPDSPVWQYFDKLPVVRQTVMEDVDIYMVHASPPDSLTDGIRLLDQKGRVISMQKHIWTDRLRDFEHDVLIIGHTHQVYAEKLGSTLVINPGSTWFNHCCAILTLPDLQVQWFALDGDIVPSWYWGARPGGM